MAELGEDNNDPTDVAPKARPARTRQLPAFQLEQEPKPKEGSGLPNWAQNLLLVGVVLTTVVGGLVFAFESFMKGDVYDLAVGHLQSDNQVIAALGSPIDASFFVTGKTSTKNGESGRSHLLFTISGPRGTGTAEATGMMGNRNSALTALRVRVDATGAVIDVPLRGITPTIR